MNPKAIIQDFLDLIGKIPHKSSYSKLETCLLSLSKLKLKKTEADILMDGILMYIDVVINISAKRSLREQIKICGQWFDVLQDFINDDIREFFVKSVTQKIFDILIEEDVNSWCVKKHLLRMFVSCIQDVPKLVRCKIVESLPDIYLFKIVDSISTYGDYDFQATLIELVFRMYGKTVVVSKLPALIPESQELSESFAKISGETFDEDVRRFLNTLNENTKKVFSIVCSGVFVGNIRCGEPMGNVNGLWVDFNRSENAVSWYCTEESLREDEDGCKADPCWNLVTFFVSDVEMIRILRPPQSDDAIIYVKLKTPCIFSHKSAIMPRAGDVKFLVPYGLPETRMLITHVLPGMFKHKFEHNTPKLSQSGRTVYKPLHVSVFKKTKSESSKSKSDISGFTAGLEPISKNEVRNDPKKVRSVSSGVSCCEVISISDSSMEGAPRHRMKESQYETAQMCPLEQLEEERQPPEVSGIKILSERCSGSKTEYNREETKRSVNAAESGTSRDSEFFETAPNFSSGKYLKRSAFTSVAEAESCLIEELPLEDVLEDIETVRNGKTTNLEQRNANLLPKCSVSEKFSQTSLFQPEEMTRFKDGEQFESILLQDVLEHVKNNKQPVKKRRENADYERAVSDNSVSDVDMEKSEKVEENLEKEVKNEEKNISEENGEAVVDLVEKSDEIIAREVLPTDMELISEKIKIVEELKKTAHEVPQCDVPMTSEDRVLKNYAAIENVDLHPNEPNSELKTSHMKVSEPEKPKTEPPKRRNRKVTSDDEVPQNNAVVDFGVVEPNELISESKTKISETVKTETEPLRGRNRKIMATTEDQVPKRGATTKIADSDPNKASAELKMYQAQISKPGRTKIEPPKRRNRKISTTTDDEVLQNNTIGDFGVVEPNELIYESKTKISETARTKIEPPIRRNRKISTKTDDEVPQNNTVVDFGVVEPNELISQLKTKISETAKTETEPLRGRNRKIVARTEDQVPQRGATTKIADSDANKVSAELKTSQAQISKPGRPKIEPQKRINRNIPTITEDSVPKNIAAVEIVNLDSNKVDIKLKTNQTKISESGKTESEPSKRKKKNNIHKNKKYVSDKENLRHLENVNDVSQGESSRTKMKVEQIDKGPLMYRNEKTKLTQKVVHEETTMVRVNNSMEASNQEVESAAEDINVAESLKDRDGKKNAISQAIPEKITTIQLNNSVKVSNQLLGPAVEATKVIQAEKKCVVLLQKCLEHHENDFNSSIEAEEFQIRSKAKRNVKQLNATTSEDEEQPEGVNIIQVTPDTEDLVENMQIQTFPQKKSRKVKKLNKKNKLKPKRKDFSSKVEKNRNGFEETSSLQIKDSAQEDLPVAEDNKVFESSSSDDEQAKPCFTLLSRNVGLQEIREISSGEAGEENVKKPTEDESFKRTVLTRQISNNSDLNSQTIREEKFQRLLGQSTIENKLEKFIWNCEKSFDELKKNGDEKEKLKSELLGNEATADVNNVNVYSQETEKLSCEVHQQNDVIETVPETKIDTNQPEINEVRDVTEVFNQEIQPASVVNESKREEELKTNVVSNHTLSTTLGERKKRKVYDSNNQSCWDDITLVDEEPEKKCEIHQPNDMIETVPETEIDTSRPEINEMRDVRKVWNREIQPVSVVNESKREEELVQTLSTTRGGRKKRKLYDPNDLSHLDNITLADKEPEKPVTPKKVEKHDQSFLKQEKKVEANWRKCQKRKTNTTKNLKKPKMPKTLKIMHPKPTSKRNHNIPKTTPVFYEMLESFRKEANSNVVSNFINQSEKNKAKQLGKTHTKKNTVKELNKINAIMRNRDEELEQSDASFKLRRQRHNSFDSPLLDNQVLPLVDATGKINILSHIAITPNGTCLEEVPRKKRQISKNLARVAEVPVVAGNVTDQGICQWIESGSLNYKSQNISERRIILKYCYPMFRSAIGANDGSEEFKDMLSICRKLKKYI